MREVSGLDELSSTVKVAYRGGNAPGENDADNQRSGFDNQESDAKEKEGYPIQAAELAEGGEDTRVELRRAGVECGEDGPQVLDVTVASEMHGVEAGRRRDGRVEPEKRALERARTCSNGFGENVLLVP